MPTRCENCGAPACDGTLYEVPDTRGNVWGTCTLDLAHRECRRCGAPKTPGYPACITCAPGAARVRIVHPAPRVAPHLETFPVAPDFPTHPQDCPCASCEDLRRGALMSFFPAMHWAGLSPKRESDADGIG